MHIGLQAPISGAEAGGGFTFEWDVLQALLNQADSRGHKVTLVAHEKPASVPAWLEARNWLELSPKVLGTTKWKSLARKIPGVISAANVVRGRRNFADRAFTNMEHAGELINACGIQFLVHTGPFALTMSAPYSTIVWDVEYREFPCFPELTGNGQWEMREAFYRSALPRATYVVVGTQVGKQQVIDFYGIPENRILILPHPTPSDALAFNTPTYTPSWMPNEPFLLYPAQFWAHKNHVGLVRAMAELRKCSAQCPKLVLTGSDKGTMAHVKSEIRRLGLDEQIRIVGFVERNDLLIAYRHALAMVYVSYCGPENLPPLEAFAAGCPVIASDIAGAREQLANAALLVDPLKPEAIAHGIQRVLESSALRASLATEGKTRAIAWTSADFAKEMIGAIELIEPQLTCWARGPQNS